jgi:hypothetical protein
VPFIVFNNQIKLTWALYNDERTLIILQHLHSWGVESILIAPLNAFCERFTRCLKVLESP